MFPVSTIAFRFVVAFRTFSAVTWVGAGITISRLFSTSFSESKSRISCVSVPISAASTVLHQLDQKIIDPHYDFKHLTEKYFEIGMKLRNDETIISSISVTDIFF